MPMLVALIEPERTGWKPRHECEELSSIRTAHSCMHIRCVLVVV